MPCVHVSVELTSWLHFHFEGAYLLFLHFLRTFKDVFDLGFEGWEGGAGGPVSSDAVDDEVVWEFGDGDGAVDDWFGFEFVFHADAVHTFDLTGTRH